MARCFRTLMRDNKSQIQDAQKTSRINTQQQTNKKQQKTIPIHILRLQKTKGNFEKKLKAKNLKYIQLNMVRVIAYFSLETTKATRKWTEMFKELKDKKKTTNLACHTFMFLSSKQKRNKDLMR